jgi:hypothetical protein
VARGRYRLRVIGSLFARKKHNVKAMVDVLTGD